MSLYKTFVLAAMAASTTAHMVIREPKPFLNSIGGIAYDNVDNSPLQEDGSNYPCHMSGPYTADFSTTYELGSTQTLAFMGSAVHGGGSCQVSITYDENPTKDSVFKVIHSIEGGCPAKNQAGNLPADSPTFEDPDTYNFPVPSDIPAGKAILAWTWFNRIGNREMYMNCAPITLTGTGGDIANFNKLPDIMVANIGAKECTVAEGTDVKFPNPGSSVDQFPFTPNSFQDVSSQPACGYNWMAGSGQGNVAAPSGGDTGSGSGSGSGASSAAPTTTAPADSATASATATGAPGGVFITTSAGGAASSETAAPTSTAATSSVVAADPTTATADPAASASPTQPATGGDSTGGTVGAACTNEGAFYCTGSGFQQCASGTWTAVRPMAAGTACTPGEAMSLNIFATKQRRGKRAQSFRA